MLAQGGGRYIWHSGQALLQSQSVFEWCHGLRQVICVVAAPRLRLHPHPHALPLKQSPSPGYLAKECQHTQGDSGEGR